MAETPFRQNGFDREILRRSDFAYERIRDAIASGEIQPGEHIRQEAWAHELNVSQATIREVFNRLAADGLVVEEPYRGVRAIVLPLEEQIDIMDIRIALESIAIEAAASRITPGDLQRMRELLPQTAETTPDVTAESAWEANRAFHWIAIEASGRRHVIRMLRSIWNLTNHYLLFTRNSGARRLSAEHILREHTALLERLEARDGAGAAEVCRQGLQRGLAMTQQQLANREWAQDG